MKQYLSNFSNRDDFTIFKHSDKYDNVSVAYLVDEDEVIYNNTEKSPYELQPFTMTVVEEGENPPTYYRPFTAFDATRGTYDGNPLWVKISTDGGHTWHKSTNHENHWDIHVKANQGVQIISNGKLHDLSFWTDNWAEAPDGMRVAFSGNILSLGGGDNMHINFTDDLIKQFGFDVDWKPWDFNKDGYHAIIKDCSNLYIPQPPYVGAYVYMFAGCRNMTTAPHIHILETNYDISGGSEHIKGLLSWTFTDHYDDSERWETAAQPLDLRNVVIDIPKNLLVNIPLGSGMMNGVKMSYPMTFTEPNITFKNGTVYTLYSMFDSAQGLTTMPTLNLHNGYLEWMFNKCQVPDLSNISVWRCGTDDNVFGECHNMTKTPKFYCNLDDNRIASCDSLTDLYLLGRTINTNLYFDNNSWSNITIHYAQWCDNLSDAQSAYSDATFSEYTDAMFLVNLKCESTQNVFANIDSVDYQEYELQMDDRYFSHSLWANNDELQDIGSNQWFHDNVASMASHVVYKGEAYELTHLGAETVTLTGDFSDEIDIEMFSYTIGSTTHKIGLAWFRNTSLCDRYTMWLPTDNDYFENITVVFSYNCPSSDVGVKFINYDLV